MYAVVEISGKQFKVEEGRFVDADLLSVEENTQELVFDKVSLISKDGQVTIGAPFISGAKIKATIVKNFKDKKVIVFKQKPKKGTRLKQGHRQPYTRVMIDSIIG
jgi:large subunit ribosomal protein L21